jgi:patatin-like phospholipase/acyl hydrolase
MDQIVKTQKDAKGASNFKMKKDVVDFIKGTLLGDILTKALAYGESLTVAKQVQTNFQTRPVLKNLFPTLKDFEYIV